MPLDLNSFEASRLLSAQKMREMGFDPFGSSVAQFVQTNDGLTPAFRSVQDARNLFENWEFRKKCAGTDAPEELPLSVSVPGRIFLYRENGKLLWLQMRDDTGSIQIAISKKDVSEPHWQLAKLMDIGDIIQVNGLLKRSNTGEITIWAKSLDIACKSLAHPPDKMAGITDQEERYRKPYLYMAHNDDARNIYLKRCEIIREIRNYLRGWVEVETPMLHSTPGGAAARPFQTHLNALDENLYLRIAPELYLKRLLVAGLPKIFEINRNFRNEGIDRSHNPEFTSLEMYEAYGNMERMMIQINDLIHFVCRALKLPNQTKFGDTEIFWDNTTRTTYDALLLTATGKLVADFSSPFEANKAFEEQAESLIDPGRPTWVMYYPSAISPLTKKDAKNPKIALRADLFIGGMEIGTVYSEENDPEEQLKAFEAQLGDNDEERTHRTLDQDFIEALKVGMPPAGGAGLGIDRLVMLLTNQTSVRDVIAFPFMRRK